MEAGGCLLARVERGPIRLLGACNPCVILALYTSTSAHRIVVLEILAVFHLTSEALFQSRRDEAVPMFCVHTSM